MHGKGETGGLGVMESAAQLCIDHGIILSKCSLVTACTREPVLLVLSCAPTRPFLPPAAGCTGLLLAGAGPLSLGHTSPCCYQARLYGRFGLALAAACLPSLHGAVTAVPRAPRTRALAHMCHPPPVTCTAPLYHPRPPASPASPGPIRLVVVMIRAPTPSTSPIQPVCSSTLNALPLHHTPLHPCTPLPRRPGV